MRAGTWDDDDIGHEKSFVCKARPPPSPPPPPLLPKSSGPFTFHPNQLSWTAAEAYCATQGGHLASIRSMADNIVVHDLCAPSACWIGFNDIETEGDWVWSDGTANTFDSFPGGQAPWNPGEPNGSPTERTDGAYMYPTSNNWVRAGTWDDDDIGHKKSFVCRGRPPPPPPPMPTTAGGYTFELVHAGVECQSDDHRYGGTFESAAACADACAAAGDCRFFIFGTAGSKRGDCYVEHTASAACDEGWEVDTFDFYELKGAKWIGCTESRARNYDPQARVDNGMCEEWDACAEGRRPWADGGWMGSCQKWRNWCEAPCDSGNVGYRNRDFDQVHAAKAAFGDVTVDGDLREWATHDARWRYNDVAFASAAGDEVRLWVRRLPHRALLCEGRREGGQEGRREGVQRHRHGRLHMRMHMHVRRIRKRVPWPCHADCTPTSVVCAALALPTTAHARVWSASGLRGAGSRHCALYPPTPPRSNPLPATSAQNADHARAGRLRVGTGRQVVWAGGLLDRVDA